jgi:hypothetical protein
VKATIHCRLFLSPSWCDVFCDVVKICDVFAMW